ncbi:MAG: RNA-binding protein [Dehalococcoidales bacterium]|nr:RNA-binding protein [Dehalococcoidales bacterium]
MKLYVGNLSFQTTDAELRKEFESFGNVDSVSIVTDRDTGRSRGFAFVEMSSESEGKEAIAGLNGKIIGERNVVINEARPRTENRGGGGYNQRSGGNRSGGSYDRRGGGNRSDSGFRGGKQRY